jgi:hypothetical protein
MSRDEQPKRTLRISKAVRAALVELRLLEQSIASAQVDGATIDSVERSLDCRLPDDLLAAFAAQLDVLRDFGFVLERIPALTSEARAAGCPADLIAVGRTEGPIYWCVPSKGSGEITLHELDGSAQNARQRGFADWLSGLAESRRDEMRGEDDDEPVEVAELEVGSSDLDSFKPRVVPPPPTTGRQVRHATFGVGEIVREIGAGTSRKLEVRFPTGTKVLIARVVEEL